MPAKDLHHVKCRFRVDPGTNQIARADLVGGGFLGPGVGHELPLGHARRSKHYAGTHISAARGRCCNHAQQHAKADCGARILHVQASPHEMAAGDMGQLMRNDRLQHLDIGQAPDQALVYENGGSIHDKGVERRVIHHQQVDPAGIHACGPEQRRRDAFQRAFDFSVADQGLRGSDRCLKRQQHGNKRCQPQPAKHRHAAGAWRHSCH